MAKVPEGPPPPWLPFDWMGHLAETAAIKAVNAGTATPEQQRMAMTAIIEHLCGYYDLSFRPGKNDETNFAEGRRFVGAQLVKLTKLNVNAILKATRKGEGDV